MPRKKKSDIPIPYYLQNCYRCCKFCMTKILEDGNWNSGMVLFICSVNNEDVMPHKIDGCKHYEYSEPQIMYKELMIKKEGDKDGKGI